jgi:hypothetical protein
MNGLVNSTASFLSAVIVKSVIAKSASFEVTGERINQRINALCETEVRFSL